MKKKKDKHDRIKPLLFLQNAIVWVRIISKAWSQLGAKAVLEDGIFCEVPKCLVFDQSAVKAAVDE